ncbi:hypothetical protein X777_16442, partial [Ooceraea biroi]
NNIETLGILLTGLAKKLGIVGVYRKPGATEPNGAWKQLLTDIETTDSLLVAETSILTTQYGIVSIQTKMKKSY